MELLERITHDPKVMGGRACVRGLRVTVGTIVGLLPPQWVDVLKAEGVESIHWTEVGDPRAPDEEVVRFARECGYVVFIPRPGLRRFSHSHVPPGGTRRASVQP